MSRGVCRRFINDGVYKLTIKEIGIYKIKKMNMRKDEKKSKDIEKILSTSKVKGINIHNFISKKLIKKLEEKYGKMSFPSLGIVFEEKKQFIFLYHESLESINKNEIILSNPVNVSNKEIKDFIKFVKENKSSD